MTPHPHDGVDRPVDLSPSIADTELLLLADPGTDTTGIRTRAHDLRKRTDSRRAGCQVTVVHPAHRASLPALMRFGDVFAQTHPRRSDAAGALEAMACGVPVVAQAADGAAELVDGLTGLVVPNDDRHVFAHALRPLLADARRHTAYGVAAADRARYSTERIAVDLERRCDRAAHAGRGPTVDRDQPNWRCAVSWVGRLAGYKPTVR